MKLKNMYIMIDIIILTCLLSAQMFAAENIQIIATLDLTELQENIKEIRKIDDGPILLISQEQRNSSSKFKRKDGTEIILQENDPDTLIIRTGILNGPLDGGGMEHHFKKLNDKWILIESRHWIP